MTLTGGGWSRQAVELSNPAEIITCDRPEDVRRCLERAEQAAADGSFVAGFVTYEAAPGLDPRLLTGPPSGELPLVWFGVYGVPIARPLEPAAGVASLGAWSAAMDEAEHGKAVASIKEAIRRGDTYQANLTFAMRSRLSGSPRALFERMLASQPRCYGALVDLGSSQILSVSPELFIKTDGRQVTARPMKGTAPRGRWQEEDLAMASSLATSEKERAGNLMIVDLIRNDLGRVSEFGSVEVPFLFETERHPTVWQLTSTVTSRLRAGVTLADLFAACFPSGSVTGAPKASTVDILSAEEIEPRGVYCGAIGYIEPGALRSEFSVAIRTGVLNDSNLRYHVGGGITWESEAEAEYSECTLKARVLTHPVRKPDLLETMRFHPAEGVELLGRHVERLAHSAAYWDIPFNPADIGDALSGVSSNVDSKVRLVLLADGTVHIEVEPLTFFPGPVPLEVSSALVDSADPIWFHKTLDRSRYPKPEEPVEMILRNESGLVTETNRSNLFARLGDKWVTPSVESGLLPGVRRRLEMERREIEEKPLTLDDLDAADELAVSNAVRGWRNAQLIR